MYKLFDFCFIVWIGWANRETNNRCACPRLNNERISPGLSIGRGVSFFSRKEEMDAPYFSKPLTESFESVARKKAIKACDLHLADLRREHLGIRSKELVSTKEPGTLTPRSAALGLGAIA